MRNKKAKLPRKILDSVEAIIKSNSITHSSACQLQRSAIRFRAWVDYTDSRLHHVNPIHPLKLIWVNPNNIDKMLVDPFENRKFRTLSPVIDGKWDQKTKQLLEYDLFRSVYNHFKFNTPWEETELYSRVRDEIKSSDEWEKWGCSNFTEFKKRLASLDQLHEAIRRKGYKTQRELETSETDPIETYKSLPPELHEITVHVDRGGQFIFHDGRHRLAISQALDLDSVPVRVMVRHRDWQLHRNKVYTEQSGTETLEHPDLVRGQ